MIVPALPTAYTSLPELLNISNWSFNGIDMYDAIRGLPAYQVADHFHSILEKEVYAMERILSGDPRETYMATLGRIKTRPQRCFVFSYRFNKRIEPAIKLIQEQKVTWVLDAGCGLGTEALLFGLMGVKVAAIDIHEDRYEAAKSRLNWWREQIYPGLDVEFYLRDTRSLIKELEIDKGHRKLVWLAEAISHIFPPDDFLKNVYNLMDADDILVVSETNNLNPIAFLSNRKEQRRRYVNMGREEKEMYRKEGIWIYPWTKQDPETGETVYISNEKLWTPMGFKRLLKRTGFKKIRYKTLRYIPNVFFFSKVVFPFLKFLETVFSRIPIINVFGVYQIIQAEKE
ncbi:MAG: class I SAM-dependent methyltransferase [bacterium]|nr:MAG: class I SAM-dependent methyltransferase [bacterium]